MNKENCALKLVDEIILYYDARSKKHQTVTLASTNNAPPGDGVTAPRHVGAVLMLLSMQILKLFLRQFTCASVGE